MNDKTPSLPREDSIAPADEALNRALAALRTRTPARLLVGRAGPAYRTGTQLELRADHAAAVDAVHAELVVERDFAPELIERFQLFAVESLALSKSQYLQRPELGRQLSAESTARLERDCLRGADLQVVIGDGLSAAAAIAQVPRLLPFLAAGAQIRGWTFGRVFVVRHCRVGMLNAIGAALVPRVVALLIGERPGLITAESLSAYMAFQPAAGHTDAQRNLVANIHTRGVSCEAAAERILVLATQMIAAQSSGVAIKEQLAEARIADNHASGIERD